MGSRADGFSLLEVLVALFLLSLGILGVAPMFLRAMEGNAASADLNVIGAAAMERMELMRSEGFWALEPGGSLAVNGTIGGVPYFDDSAPGYVVRWRISGVPLDPGRKIIVIRAIEQQEVSGPPKQVTLTALRTFR